MGINKYPGGAEGGRKGTRDIRGSDEGKHLKINGDTRKTKTRREITGKECLNPLRLYPSWVIFTLFLHKAGLIPTLAMVFTTCSY